VLHDFVGVEADDEHVRVQEDQDLAGELLVLQICLKNRDQALDELLAHRAERLGETLAEVLHNGLQIDEDLAHEYYLVRLALLQAATLPADCPVE